MINLAQGVIQVKAFQFGVIFFVPDHGSSNDREISPQLSDLQGFGLAMMVAPPLQPHHGNFERCPAHDFVWDFDWFLFRDQNGRILVKRQNNLRIKGFKSLGIVLKGF
jgi:hypothetical protein